MTGEYDVAVIGAGAAGLSAGLVLARARVGVAVIGDGDPRNARAEHLHGVLAVDGMSPARFTHTGREEVAGYGGTMIDGRVRSLQRDGHGFRCELATGQTMPCRAVVVATGLRDELPDIEGLRQRWGIDVLHCPYCHGYEVQDGPIAVIGGENRPFTLHQALLLRRWSEDVQFFTHHIGLTTEERERLTVWGVRVVDEPVTRIRLTGERISGVETADGTVHPRSTVFVGPRFVPLDSLLTTLGCELSDNGWVQVDPTGRTSVPGVWAAGNVVSEGAQLVNAAAAGSLAAISLNHYLLARDVDQAVRDRRTGAALTPAPTTTSAATAVAPGSRRMT